MRYAVSVTFTKDTIDKLSIRTYLAIVTAESEDWATQTAIERFEEIYEGFRLISTVVIDIDAETSIDLEASSEKFDDDHCICPVDHGFYDDEFELKCNKCNKIYVKRIT
jgi:hypothetical protein